MASQLTMEENYDKHYDHIFHYEAYHSKDSIFTDDVLVFPIKQLYKVFESGAVKGDTLITIGKSFRAAMLATPAAFFKEIIVAGSLEGRNEELRKWLNNDPDAMDYDESLKRMCELEGDRERWSEKKELVQRTVRQVVKCDIMKSNPLFPLSVPQADCLLTVYYVEINCLHMNSYRTALRNISSLLKIGGRLVMIAVLGCTFFFAGKMKLSSLWLDEGCLREAVCDAGYAIEKLEVFPRSAQDKFDISDYTHLGLLVACKQRNV